MWFKPKWYSALPEPFKPKNTVRQLEKLRESFYVPDEVFAYIILGSKWATHRVQTFKYFGMMEAHPELSHNKLLRMVLISTLEDMEEIGLLTIDEIDLNFVIPTIHSIEDISNYIVKLHESIEPENANPFGISMRIEDILKRGNGLPGLENYSNSTSAYTNREITKKGGSIKSGEDYFSIGLDCLDKSEFNDAIINFCKVLELIPNYKRAYCSRGVAYWFKDDNDRAIADFNKAIELDPNRETSYYNRAMAYFDMGDYKNAIIDYSKSIEFEPEESFFYYNRGKAYNENGEYDMAIADFSTAIEMSPNYEYAYFNRGLAYYKKGDFDQAIADFNKAMELGLRFGTHIVDVYYYYFRGLTYRDMGKVIDARRDFLMAKEKGLEKAQDELNNLNNVFE